MQYIAPRALLEISDQRSVLQHKVYVISFRICDHNNPNGIGLAGGLQLSCVRPWLYYGTPILTTAITDDKLTIQLGLLYVYTPRISFTFSSQLPKLELGIFTAVRRILTNFLTCVRFRLLWVQAANWK